MLNREFREAGAREQSARAPDSVDAAWFRDQAGELERILRLQHEGGQLDPRDEDELARHDPSEMTGAIRRFAFLKHLYYRRSEDLVRRDPESADVQEIARQLLTAEPIRIQLAGTEVEVTDRSYSAMHAIAAHWVAVQMLRLDTERAQQLLRRIRERRDGLGWTERGERRRLDRHFRRAASILRRTLTEIEGHRQAIYAHAFTHHGGPADSLQEAPTWWRRIDPREDAVLVAAFLEVGARRYDRLGPPPEAKRDDQGDAAEDFGWASLFATIERQQKVAPASAYDRRLYQQLTWLRAAAPAPLEELED